MSQSIPPSSIHLVPETPAKLHHLRIRHSRISKIMNDLETLIHPDSQDSILLVCGPTGVGKSTLAQYMVERAIEKESAQMEQDAGMLPAIYIQAPASGEKDFSWRLFYQRILDQLDSGLTIPKAHYGLDMRTGNMIRPHGRPGNSLASLRTAVERGLRARKTQFLVIDEAAHIIRQTQPNRLEIQLDTLKSLANECGTQMVLVGSYDLYQLMSLSGQLARRTHVLHFQRYLPENATDLNDFQGCLQKFENALPSLWDKGLLVKHSSILLENTLGCIGTLSAVLTRAAKLAHADGRWSVNALNQSFLTHTQHRQILEEILAGEAELSQGLNRTMPAIKTQRSGGNKACTSH